MKHLKIWGTLLLVVLLAMSLAACGTGSAAEPSGSMEGQDTGAFSSASQGIYGKITEITGNEITIAIAKKPEENGTDNDELKGNIITPNENDAPMVGDEIDDSVDNLDFTGENKSFIIPAGTKISSMGQEINLSSLKKGDIISVIVDADNPDTVVSVDKVR